MKGGVGRGSERISSMNPSCMDRSTRGLHPRVLQEVIKKQEEEMITRKENAATIGRNPVLLPE